MQRPKIGISACLLGKLVRYNGDHKRQDWLVDSLGPFVEWQSACPEVEMGMGVPRESIHLEQDDESRQIRLVGNQSKTDYTERALTTSRTIVDRMEGIHGFVFKKDSPSCGLERVRLFNTRTGIPARVTRGIFAETMVESRSNGMKLPMVEEGRLSDPAQSEHFISRVFAYARWTELKAASPGLAEIQKFHQRHKLFLMAHSPRHYQLLGQLASGSAGATITETLAQYEGLFLEALAKASTRGKRVNVLQHVFGYFKIQLDKKEKRRVLEALEDYRTGRISLVAPMTLLGFLVEKHSIAYLGDQVFFDPYPKELGLWNSV